MTAFNINIVSDPICPFCYLGKRRLDRAIDVYKKTIPGGSEDTFNITWKPYYLDPTLPKGKSFPVLECMAQKFGADHQEAITQHLSRMGQTEGICFSFQGKLGNTTDAHRLVQLARTKGGDVQHKLMAEMMKGYFEEGADITSHEMLLSAGEKAGLDAAEAKQWLEEGKGGGKVDEEVEWAYSKGIRGVPHFIINDRFEVGGAQEVDAFLSEFLKAKEAA
ncbi:Uncharacterized protein YwbO [Cytospora mali]|uniref:Uncharacterized protein YwbO n=1 Tax=Cytospora mali TaxID=578113 RepID=A0A194VD20_CYTMA|nr:Uncharacterized protein YwbO [Valsa mali var. pyri (nom. inval.)]